MTLSVTGSPSTGFPTSLTIVSDKRKIAAIAEVTESATISINAAGETRVYNATRVVSPAVPARIEPITITDSRAGVTWVKQADDGITAVYVPA
jgi:hypothetical protein